MVYEDPNDKQGGNTLSKKVKNCGQKGGREQTVCLSYWVKGFSGSRSHRSTHDE